MIVKESQVEAALAIKDGDRVAEVHYAYLMAKIAYEEAVDEAFCGLNDGSVREREARVSAMPSIRKLRRALAVAQAEEARLKIKLSKADAIIELYRTESANTRKGVL